MGWKSVVPPILILLCVAGLLYPVVVGNQVLLPARDLAFMEPWASDQTIERTQHQWNPLMWDGLAQFYPWRHLYSKALHQGELPLWNPYQFCGDPVYANVQSAVFYPPNVIFYLMEPARALGYSALLHLFMAGLFAYLLAASLGMNRTGATVSGLVYSLCAFNVTWLELPTVVDVAAWLPLLLLLIRQALVRQSNLWAVCAGLALAMALLAGHLQIALYLIFAAVLWSLWIALDLRRTAKISVVSSAGRLIIGAVVGFGIAAVQLVPSFELAALSHRVAGKTLAGYFSYADTGLPTMNLITAFVPDFFGNPARNTFWGKGNYTEFAMYVGILPIALATAGLVFSRNDRQNWFFAALATITLLMALGTPLAAVLYFLIPGFSATGSPARILLLYCFSLAMLAGFGASAFASEWPQTSVHAKARRIVKALVVFAGLILVFVATGFYTKHALSVLPDRFSEQVALSLPYVFLAGGLMLLAAAVIVMRAVDMIRPRMAVVLVILMTAADLLVFGYHYNATASGSAVYPSTSAIRFLQEVSGHDRIMPLNPGWSLSSIPPAVLPPNSATVFGLRDTQGYDSLFPGYYKRFAHRLQGRDPSPVENGNMVLFKRYDRKAGLYAKYVVSVNPVANPDLQLLYQDDVFIYRNQKALPRLSAHQLTGHHAARTRITRDGLNSVQMQVHNDEPARVDMRDLWYPGWVARINGRETPITRQEQVFRSVIAPAGVNTITFDFEPFSLRLGLFISTLCLGSCACYFVVCAGRRRVR